jgi:predicted nucleotidyltransferase
MSGSKLYGTDNENSDTDLKGIFIPSKDSKKDLSSYVKDTNNSKVKNSAEDIDFTLHSIYSFFNQLQKSETGSIDVLFSMFRDDTIVFQDEEIVTNIKDNYKIFLNSNMKSFIGYALGQTKKFGIKGARYGELDSFVKEYLNTLSTEVNNKKTKISILFDEMKSFILKKNYKYIKFTEAPGPRGSGSYEKVEYISVLDKMFEGNVSVNYFIERIMKLYDQFGNRTKTIAKTKTKTDFKALSHSLRIAEEVKELLETEYIKFPLRNSENIREVKEGKHNVEEVINKIQDILAEVDILLLKSKLPEEVNQEEIEKFLIELLFKK